MTHVIALTQPLLALSHLTQCPSNEPRPLRFVITLGTFLCDTTSPSSSPSFPPPPPNPHTHPHTTQVESPRHFFIHLLLKRPQSLWDTQLDLKRPEQSVEWSRCSEYFEFRARLLQNLYGKRDIVLCDIAYSVRFLPSLPSSLPFSPSLFQLWTWTLSLSMYKKC